MGPPSYMRSLVDRNVVMRRISLYTDVSKERSVVFFRDKHQLRVFIVVPCMLFQSLLYCSNSCTSLHFKILKSHTKTLKILKSHTKTLKLCPSMFRPPLKPSSRGPWPYFAKLLNWNVDLHLL